ncbi:MULTISPECIES: alpha/beta hydrolase [Rhodobacterales]|nr:MULTISPECIES: alpha/beta hydrolase [Rhodobacterales]MDK3020414.1 alpha/beta fold hydrolase [Pseudodonghicola flavimaris]
MTTRAQVTDYPETFGGNRADKTTFLEYIVSVPPNHQPGKIEWPDLEIDAARHFAVRNDTILSAEAFSRKASQRHVGVYIHGFNTNYQEALFRGVQLAADAQIDGEPIVFSWPSEGSATAYLADRDASDFSRAALADLLTMLTKGRSVSDPLPVLAHSMGARMTMEALVHLSLAGRSDVLDRTVLVLAAPDIDIDLFRKQMASIGKTKHPITILVSSDDRALKISARLAADRTRLGAVDVNDPAIQQLIVDTGVRIVDVTQIESTDSTHSRYIGLFSGVSSVNVNANPFGGVRHAGAFVFNNVGDVFQVIGGALSE